MSKPEPIHTTTCAIEATGFCTCGVADRTHSAAHTASRAYLSEDGLYRYSLTRDLGTLGGEGTCTFVMLNPSTADATQDDPTIRRCVRFAREWGLDRLKVVNLYALRATDPKALWLADDPVGPENDHVLSLAFGSSDLTIAAWGVHAKPERVAEIMAWPLRPHLCLGLTKDGCPRHPLYLRCDTKPQALPGEEAEAWLLTA